MGNPLKIVLASITVVVVFCLLMFPYIWEGKEVVVNVWDNLDSNLVWYKTLKDQGKIFAGPWVNVEGFMTATPRFSYPSGFNVEALLFYALSPYNAYWINKMLISLVAFLGMVLLFSGYSRGIKWEVVGIGFLWASLAYNPHIGISIAGLPLLYWAFLHIREGKFLFSPISAVVFYSFYSSFVLVGVFTLLVFLCCLIHWRILDGKFSKTGILAIVIMGLCYLVQEYNLFYFFFLQKDFVSHRKEINYLFNSFSNHSPWFFIKNGNHNGAFYWWGYVLLVAGAAPALFFNKQARVFTKNLTPSEKDTLMFALVLFIALPLIGSFFSWAPVVNAVGKVFPLIHSFNLQRITFLFPFFLFLLLGFGLVHFHFRYKALLIGLLLAVNLFVYQFEWRNMLNNRFGFLEYQVPTFAQFYAVQQFDDIKEYLGEDWNKTYIGSVNIPPAVGAFNGFNTIDGYLPLYALDYKTEFREIIEGELAKDRELFEHFQYWGNKCYLQNATHPDLYNAYKWEHFEPIYQLDFDFDLLKEGFNTPYLVSAVEIQHTRLQLLKRFTHKGSAWDIYLYKIK